MMTPVAIAARAFVALTAAALLCGAARAETVRVGGTGGALELMRLAAEPFRAASGDKIDVLGQLGSHGAIRALGAGALEVAVAARPLEPGEQNGGLAVVPFARTALVFVSSHPSPDRLTGREIVALFAARDPRWRDGSRVHLILRTKLDADTELIKRMFPGMDAAITAARQRPELPVAVTDQDNASLAERLPGSLVQAGLGQMVAERRNLRFVAIDGVEPSLETLATGAYPHPKLFYLVYAVARAAPAERLLSFLRSPEGHRLLRDNGYLPAD